MILAPLKLTLTRTADSSMSDTEKSMQQTAVHCAIGLIDISRQLLECLLPVNAKFYLATFLIFDTAAYLCSAIAHNVGNLPQREKTTETIGSALNMLDQVRNTKLGAICYAILRKILPNLPLEGNGSYTMPPRLRAHREDRRRLPTVNRNADPSLQIMFLT